MPNCDFLVVGAGIVGLTIAREIKQRYKSASITVLEKEPCVGRHSSGRNSGVLHSGIYYPPKSLKAKVCSQGAREMAEFCREHKLPLVQRGKVLVATEERDAPQLDLLLNRAAENGIQAEKLDAAALRTLEPEARSATGTAIWVPSTSVGSPEAVIAMVQSEIQQMGINLLFNAEITAVDESQAMVKLKNQQTISYGVVINAAGLYADRVAHQFDVGRRYTLLPFKGLYWKLDPQSGITINHLIYPVPDLRVPFLGVHTTTTSDGTTYLGPTAVPAFGRENYHGLQGVTIGELLRIVGLLAQQFVRGQDGFRRLTWQEGRRYFKPWFAQAAKAILPRLEAKHLLPTSKVGIRAQMLDRQSGKLVSDFLIEKGRRSVHILNAISPAWTSAFPFARYVCDQFIERKQEWI